MDNLAPTEKEMWKLPTKQSPQRLTDEEINAKYAKRELRIVTESNREQLPNFVEALKRPGWMELRPFYQRRPRWDKARQSKLIESFIMNVPVPPLFVYESDLANTKSWTGNNASRRSRTSIRTSSHLKGSSNGQNSTAASMTPGGARGYDADRDSHGQLRLQ